MSVTGTYLDGNIVLDAPLAIPNGKHLTLLIADAEELCADGSQWPVSKAEVEAWCRRVEGLPPLYDEAAEVESFESTLQSMRRERAAGLAAHSDRVAGLFAE